MNAISRIFSMPKVQQEPGRSKLCKGCLNYRGRGKCAVIDAGPVVTFQGTKEVNFTMCTYLTRLPERDFDKPLPLP